MFYQTHVVMRRIVAVVGFWAFTATASATSSAQPSNGLGQSWPNAQDVSVSPRWHVYLFLRDGVQYVQMNDQNGTVHAAFATANGEILFLPVGIDSQRIAQAQPSSLAVSDGELVYREVGLTLYMVRQDAVASWVVVPAAAYGSQSVKKATVSSSICLPDCGNGVNVISPTSIAH